MKNVAFVASHLGSGSSDLVDILNRNPRVVMHKQGADYDHPLKLNWMFNFGHKLNNSAAIYGDHLLHNSSFRCKALYGCCKFIYVIRPAKQSINKILDWIDIPENAAKYYTFRMQRIAEMAKRTPGAVLLTWDNLASGAGFSLLEEYLNLVEPLKKTELEFLEDSRDSVDSKIIDQAQDSFERYFYYLKQLDLRKI